MSSNQTKKLSPHVLIFPLPLQGPVNSMLKLAQLLCLHSLRTTFLNTHHIQRRLPTRRTLAGEYPDLFRFHTVPDGLPEDCPRTGDQIPALLESIDDVTVPIIREMVGRGGAYGPDSDCPVTCIIADGIFTFAVDVAAEIGVPLFYFDTISPCGLWAYLCVPKLIEAGELPFKDDNLDEMIVNVPGMEGILRRRDLPSFCRSSDIHNDTIIKLVLKEASHIPLAHGLIFNTFHHLESTVLSHFRATCPNTYAVGPLHSHLRSKLGPTAIISNSIWEEDRTCLSWLDSQPPRSVVYVSIGSLAVMTKEQLVEIWHGLVESGSRFLWVRRPGSIIDEDDDVVEVEQQLSLERGFIVRWAPQEMVLGHPAVGGVLTHSGWNSTLESVVEGKPMVCLPYTVDQQVNSRFVEEVWKVGLDMKDRCERGVVGRMVREVMETRKDEFLERARGLAELAEASVKEGGSSAADLERLIQDIKMIKV